jgi:NADH dehydrogenase
MSNLSPTPARQPAAHDAERAAARHAALAAHTAVTDAPPRAGDVEVTVPLPLAREDGAPQGARPLTPHSRRPHVVIVGGGFGGLNAARALKRADVDITLVDRTNHHLFQPLLYQVATAVLAPSDITIPIRYVLRGQKNVTVLMADVKRIDPDTRTLYLDDAHTPLVYDYLIVAAGARHSYFGHDDWEAEAPGLKSIADAYESRRRFLTAFEQAEKATTEAERQAWLTFVIVGGGPTGVEMAGIIPDTARRSARTSAASTPPTCA